MSEVKNVSKLDSVIRIFLSVVCVGLLGYYFAVESTMPIYVLIVVIVAIPFFLKTGATKVCLIMKAMDMSTVEKK